METEGEEKKFLRFSRRMTCEMLEDSPVRRTIMVGAVVRKEAQATTRRRVQRGETDQANLG